MAPLLLLAILLGPAPAQANDANRAGRNASSISLAKRLPKPYGEQPRFSADSLPKPVQLNVIGKKFVEIPHREPSIADEARSNLPASAAGVVTVAAVSDIGPYLRSNSPLVASADLVSGGTFSNLPSSVRQPLKSEHFARSAERDAMLPEADAIDDLANNRLDPWKKRLDANLAKLEADTVPYTAATEIHRSRCMPARDEATWKWCLEDAKVLEEWLGKLVKRGNEHNAELKRFHAESKPYDSRLAALVAKIEAWIVAVEDLVGRIKRAIGATQSCTWTGKRYPPGDPNGLCVYDCTISGVTYILPNVQLNPPCPTIRLDVPVPPVGGAGAAKD